MRPTYALLALLPLLFSASCVYAVPLDELAISQSADLDFQNADEAEDYGADDFTLGLGGGEADEDEELRGGGRRRVYKAVKKILKPPSVQRRVKGNLGSLPAPSAPTVLRRAAPAVLPVSVAVHKLIPVPAAQSAKADKVAHYISVLNTDIDKNHRVFMDQYNAELAKLRSISKRKLYTEEEYLKAQRELHAKYKVWKDTLHAFSVSNSTLSSLRHHNSSFTEEKNLLTHLYEYVKMFSTKQGYYKHNCVCNATIVGDLRSVQSATTLS